MIENVVTHGDYRKHGFGKQILQHTLDAAWKASCYKVMLMTGSTKRETLDFYLGVGFEQSKTGFRYVEFRREPKLNDISTSIALRLSTQLLLGLCRWA